MCIHSIYFRGLGYLIGINMNVQAKIKKWGNSLALRLSGPMVALPHFEENMLVNVHITDEGIEVKPIKSAQKRALPFSEEDLLEGITAKRAHADELIKLTKRELGD